MEKRQAFKVGRWMDEKWYTRIRPVKRKKKIMEKRIANRQTESIEEVLIFFLFFFTWFK